MSITPEMALHACVERIAKLATEIDYRKNGLPAAQRARIAEAVAAIHAETEAIDTECNFGVYAKEVA